MTHALVKLSVATTGHGWVVTAVDFGDMVTLYVGNLVHGQVSRKGHLTRQVKEKTGTCSDGQMLSVAFENNTCYLMAKSMFEQLKRRE